MVPAASRREAKVYGCTLVKYLDLYGVADDLLALTNRRDLGQDLRREGEAEKQANESRHVHIPQI